MAFNSFVFALFLPTVLALYWLMRRSTPSQNWLLLVASYLFYGYWDWRFLALLGISTVVDYVVALRVQGELGANGGAPNRAARRWLILSIVTNLGILGFFKYFNFFADSFAALLASAGLEADPLFLNIILPVGISFYTFQTLSYTIDVYRGVLTPTRRLLDFAVYVAFFPQLVAGPIERARTLLPQITDPRRFDGEQFADYAHFTDRGAARMAQVLAAGVASLLQGADPVGAVPGIVVRGDPDSSPGGAE